jgi:MYXO-CTERM domain-containing protein
MRRSPDNCWPHGRSPHGRSHRGRLALLAAATATALTPLALEQPAAACGGLFCNGPPANQFLPLPVAQNGENVVFAITKDPAGGAPTIDAHIQILYTGDAAKFSWVVPVEAVPTLSTGTDRLFSQLAAVTQPSFNVNYTTSGTCIVPPAVLRPPQAGPADAAATGAGGSGGTVLGPAGVQVAFQGAVGPFDAAVVMSTDPTALKTWLTTNGYVVTDQASGIIDMYVREMKYFVALKLLNGVGVSAIQPIVLTFKGTEPCVPLRLTKIAANPDMPVLVWVLSDKRAVPRGFYEIKIDDARIDWWARGASYFGPKGLVSQAANDAGGNAFIAEYAGPSNIASGRVFQNGQIDLQTLRNAQIPPTYVQALVRMGLANDPLMLGLLQKYIPMPDAVKAMSTGGDGGVPSGVCGFGPITPAQFYGNISCYWNQYAFPPYDLAGLTDAISTSIVTPRMNAQMMIDAHPYLTRLNTYLSPDEMNQDAFFFESTNLPDVSNVHTATIELLCGNMDYMACNAPQRLHLPDGRIVWLTSGTGLKSTSCSGANYDVTPLASLPVAQVAYMRDVSGEGTKVVDNTAKIQAGVDANNARIMQAIPNPTGGFWNTVPGGGAGTGVNSSGLGGAGGVSSAGGFPNAGGGGGGGCGCSVSEGGGTLAVVVIAAALAVVSLRRRRRDCSED